LTWEGPTAIVFLLRPFMGGDNPESGPGRGCSGNRRVGEMTTRSHDDPFERVDVAQAKELIESGKVYLLDVREQNEWNEGYIEGATRISVNDIVSLKRVNDLPKDKPIVFYCAGGVRSALAAELAAAVGVPGPLYNMEGGIEAWKKARFPVAKD
jgi:rhodanese-related sulfurtransferase